MLYSYPLESYVTNKEKDVIIEFECNCVTQVTRKNTVGETKSNEELTADLLEEYVYSFAFNSCICLP